MGQRWNNNEFSDYGSGNTSDSSTMSWGGPEKWVRPDFHEVMKQTKQKASSYVDLVMGRCTLDDVMQEFKMNGSDSPYTPDDDGPWAPTPPRRQVNNELSGMGLSGAYLRQKSWPEPDRTPVARLPPRWLDDEPTVVPDTSTPLPPDDVMTSEQLRVLSSLPNAVLYSFLKIMEQARAGDDAARRGKKHTESKECRFCKNNGERECYYKSHELKDATGRVRCPVLRAFVCRRCGARGDNAHTIKYCPLSTTEERTKSAAMMRSVRQASGRRRASPPEYVMFGETPAAMQDYPYNCGTAPLDPLWAALEQKLML